MTDKDAPKPTMNGLIPKALIERKFVPRPTPASATISKISAQDLMGAMTTFHVDGANKPNTEPAELIPTSPIERNVAIAINPKMNIGNNFSTLAFSPLNSPSAGTWRA